jgi:CubicO group peptidase (beta-lactamase class C family)
MRRIVLLLGCICLAVVAYGQRADRSLFIRDSLDVYINRAMTGWRIPGVAICVVKDNQVVLMKGFGIKEMGLNEKVDENTLFMIGSNTKAFTATALAMLADAGNLSLDDKVTKYFPWFKLDDKPAGEMATVRDLLCHRLGLKTFQGDFTFYNSDLTRLQITQKMGQLKAPYPFRTKWGYSNSAFLTAGEIIPRVSGKSWETYLKENIFAPLGMNNTLTLTAELPKSLNRTVPHTFIDERLSPVPYGQLDNLAPAMSISSSVNDMSKWVMTLLNNGKVGARQVIPAAAIAATRTPQDVVGTVRRLNGQTNYSLYGLGWHLEDYAGHNLVMHDGGVTGYVSSVALVPDERLGIIILTNTDQNDLYEALKWELIDVFLKLPFRNYSEQYLVRAKNEKALQQQTDKKLRDSVALNLQPVPFVGNFAGTYHNDLYGNVTVTRGLNNDLEMRFEHHPRMFAKLQPLGGARFYTTFSDPIYGKTIFPFTIQNGRVISVRVKVDDFIESDPYEFKKIN